MRLFSALTDRLREGLQKSRESFRSGLDRLFTGREVDEALFEELTELMIGADMGVSVAEAFTSTLREEVRRARVSSAEDVRGLLRRELERGLEGSAASLSLDAHPSVWLLLGVNGSGKTTTVGKLAHMLRAEGKSVILAAADTFRAAAIEQLDEWGARAGAIVVKQQAGADPAAVVFDAVKAAGARQADALLIDTAGRLQTKVNLMEELAKLTRVIAKQLPGAPHERLMVLDATTGQNGLSQAKLFHQAVGLTGLVVTKLDGTAKGGIIVRIYQELGIPIKLIGVGERVDDLHPFDPKAFLSALLPD
ncbi:MAG TPA: signal recognition particle-docking protein FtsY [Methylomirabilota bacterium]|nr:signal recognition particle-docking protein FtsY [Methylomirabilota bacterium]